ncbi:MAG: insulinase family protein [Phenylobacterium sp.]|uniref:M16 family metallopeptidase n=1 Tax=Phenylobacterium sp. TaxID=1871053 RepID=UPI002733F76B|nr:insulinase family protein [Phenylobacterium sp.]MDP1641424.1 insulinase family protein [Phenylobacterium sp.]MDP3118638.1 insulinase family protein [Phenylobacterium sp.]
MIGSPRAALALIVALALAGFAGAAPLKAQTASPSGAVAQPQARASLEPGQWPQAITDVAPDPEIRFGTLPNGMRYAIRRQTIPEGQAALRLRIDAGSLMERDDQQGLAHFLEHMAFNGSEAVPEGEMIKILERLGLAFGADTNASTGFDETIYKLDLPRTDAETVSTSLMLLRETAMNLLIAQDAVDRERGIVLSEERARDTPPYRLYKSRLAFLLKDQRLNDRYPIGDVEVLRTAPASAIRDFYQAYYRPERTLLVAAGDFDVDAMEAQIIEAFGGWTVEGPAGDDPDLGQIPPRGLEARVAVEPGVQAALQMAWVRAPDERPDSQARRRGEVVEQLGFSVLNRRLSALARASDPPFLGAGAFVNDEFGAAETTSILANAQQGRWREALSAIEAEQRRLLQHGVRQDELDREIAEYRARLQANVAGAATRRPSALAQQILGATAQDQVVTSPADDLALFDAAVDGLEASAVSRVLAQAFQGQGPLIFLASPTPIEGGEAAVLAAYETSRANPVSPPEALAQLEWPYASFGTPGKVVETREIADLDTVFIRFENGVRLTVKPTRFQDDEILISVNVGDGLQSLPADAQSLAWAAQAFAEGGLGQITAEDMERVLASRVYGLRLRVSDEAFTLSGETRPEDLDVQMQVMGAYLTDPAWRGEAFARIQAAGATIHEQYEATANGVLSRDLAGLLHAGDRRWTFPSKEEIADARLEDLRGQLAPLGNAPIEVVIIGDTTVEKATEAVAQTLGALPPRPERTAAAQTSGVAFPAAPPAPLRRTHKGRDDQSIGYVAWPSTDFFADPQAAREAAVLGEILRLRLTEELRESQGATYSPSVNYNHSYVWEGWGYMSASVEIPPAGLDAFFADVAEIAADLRTTPVEADELERARQPRLERIARARVTNGYWLSELSGGQADPRRLDAIRAVIPGTERVTAEDVQRAAERILRPDTAWKIEVVPEE